MAFPSGMYRHPVPEDVKEALAALTRDKVMALRDQGWSWDRIGPELGIGRANLEKFCKLEGIPWAALAVSGKRGDGRKRMPRQ